MEISRDRKTGKRKKRSHDALMNHQKRKKEKKLFTILCDLYKCEINEAFTSYDYYLNKQLSQLLQYMQLKQTMTSPC